MRAGQKLWEMYGPQDEQSAGMHADVNQHHAYNIQLVPMLSATGNMGYQYTWTENTYERNQPLENSGETNEGNSKENQKSKPLATTFHFQISPMTIKTMRKPVTLMELVMRLWSIVGGVYVMCMLLDRTVHSSKQFVFGRHQGKLL